VDGKPIVDAKGRRSYVTSAGSGPSVGKHLLMSYLPPKHAVVGEKLLVEYLGEQYPVSVAVVGATPLFDPENLRVRAGSTAASSTGAPTPPAAPAATPATVPA
jgi:glycine cleavage system aminomethyltransferase T